MIDFSVQVFTCTLSAVLSIACLLIILSPQVNEGLVTRLGLSCMALGYFFAFTYMLDGLQTLDIVGVVRALMFIAVGMGLVMVGYPLRSIRAQHPLRRANDWRGRRAS